MGLYGSPVPKSDGAPSGAGPMSAGRLQGKVCVVTGAGNGIGAPTAELFVEHGAAALVCTDLDGDAAEAMALRIRQAGDVAAGHAIDIADGDAVPPSR